MKQSNGLFVFFQGHPEYDSDSLILEYIRDVRHFIEGKREIYPDAPVGIFDAGILDKLEECRLRAAGSRDADCFNDVTRTIRGQKVENTWRSPAERIYRNWLNTIIQKKRARKQRETGPTASSQLYSTT
jgi:homoserine O-succinyltransferase